MMTVANKRLHVGRVIAAAMLCVFLVPVNSAQANSANQEEWSEWTALGDGMMGRRKVPTGIDKPISERRAAKTKEQRKAQRKKMRKHKQARTARFGLDALSKTSRITAVQDIRQFNQNDAWLMSTDDALHSVSITDLASEFGLSAGTLRTMAKEGQLGLRNGRAPVWWHFQKGRDRIVFPAQAWDTFFSNENATRFTLNKRLARKMAVVKKRGSVIPATGNETAFRELLKFEEEPDLLFAPATVLNNRDADFWYWGILFTGFASEFSVDLNVPNPAPSGSATIKVNLHGFTDLLTGDDHSVSVEVNGVQVGSVLNWGGLTSKTFEASFDQSLLDPSGNNTVTLNNLNAPSEPAGQYLNDISIEYDRLPIAENGSLWMHNVAAGNQTVTGLPSENVLVVESPLGDAKLRRDIKVEADGSGAYTLTFSSSGGSDFLIADNDATAIPTLEMNPRAGLRKTSNQADALIIAPRELSASANALANYRSATFGQVKIVWVHDIYDEFSFGRENPKAIHRFINVMQKRWALSPDNVTILGRGSMDHKDRMGFGDSFIPVLMTQTPFGLAASDDRLLGGNGLPDIAFARLPIVNDEQGIAYINKLIQYEADLASGGNKHVVLAADDPDEGGDFHKHSDELAAALTALGFDSTQSVYYPTSNVRSSLTDSATWQQASLVSYEGHGALSQVGNGTENFMSATDAAALSNTSYPLFTALTCTVGNFSFPGKQSVAEALVLNPTGGAISSVSATSLSFDEQAHAMTLDFVNNLYGSSSTIGQALKEAEKTNEATVDRFMPRIYTILGEPNIRGD